MAVGRLQVLPVGKLQTSARRSPVFDCLYSENENVIIPNRRRLPENRKN